MLALSTSANLPDAFVGTSYAIALTGTGGVPPYGPWAIQSGALPLGVNLDTGTGALSGIPTRAEAAAFMVSLEDSTTASATGSHTINVFEPAVLAISNGPSYDFGLTTVGVRSTQLFVVRNNGGFPATISGSSPALATPFSFVGGSFPGASGTCVSNGTLLPGETCALDVEFLPSSSISDSADLSISYNNGVSTTLATRSLKGRGTTGLLARQVIAGDDFSCALLSDRTVRCWGRNHAGQLGYGDIFSRGDDPGEMGVNLPPVDLGSGEQVEFLTNGWASVCALLSSHRIKCWGSNTFGALGQEDTNHRGDGPNEMGDFLSTVDLGTDRHVSNLFGGDETYCAVLDDGGLKCWGQNTSGALGLGDTNNRGDEPGEMGDALPYIDLGLGRTAVQVGGYETSICATLDNGQLKCWGQGLQGELGLGDIQVRGDQPGEMGDNLPVVDLGAGRSVTSIRGSTHLIVCALLDNASVKCWGRNDLGQLGQGDIQNRGDDPGEMGDNLLPIDLGAGRSATNLILGLNHVCTILDNGGIKCWGAGSNGRLGQGNTANRGDDPSEMGDFLPEVAVGTGVTVVSGGAGGRHTCVILSDDTIKCWGSSVFGQLGQGNTFNLGDGSGEMGDSLPRVDLALVP